MAILPTVKPSPRPESQVSFTIVTWAIEINLWSAIKDSNVPNVPCTFHVFDGKIIQKMNHWMGNAFHIPGRSGSLCALQYLGRSPRIHWCGPGPLQSLPHARYIPGHDPHRTMVAADPAAPADPDRSRSPWGLEVVHYVRDIGVFSCKYVYIYYTKKICNRPWISLNAWAKAVQLSSLFPTEVSVQRCNVRSVETSNRNGSAASHGHPGWSTHLQPPESTASKSTSVFSTRYRTMLAHPPGDQNVSFCLTTKN